MWAYNGQTESGQGCWNEAVCAGNGAYDMFDGRKLQYFCNDEQTNAAAQMSAPFELQAASAKHFDKFEPGCMVDEDCPDQNRHLCTAILWDGTQDGSSYANGSACYNWTPDEKDLCTKGFMFA